MKRVYRALLYLYPRSYREMFAQEMSRAFELTAEELRGQGIWTRVSFALAEILGLLKGAGAEWISKGTTGTTIRRRPAASRELCFAEAGVRLPTPDDVAEAEQRVARLIGRMVHAIATHDFPKARAYSFEERDARDQLRRLREKYGIAGADFGLLG